MRLRDLPSFREYLGKVYAALRKSPELLPPSKVQAEPPVFSGDYPSWEAASAACGGYDADEIFLKTKAAILAVRDGCAAFERDSVLFDRPEYRWEPLAAILWQAARDEGRAGVLDFGGSLGSVYFQHRAYFSTLASLKWGVVEQRHYVEFGERELSSEHLHFFPDIKSCSEAIRPNVAFLGASLQYLASPGEILDQILALQVSSIVFDKLALVDRGNDRLTVQLVPKHIYNASYPAWFFFETRFLERIKKAGYRCVSEWRNVDDYPLDGVKTAFKGYHFVREWPYG